MSISFGSINTGLPKDIVQKLMESEKIPLKQMTERKGKLDEKKTLIQDLAGKIDNLKEITTKHGSEGGLRVLKALYNKEIIDLQIDQEIAKPGNYQFSSERLSRKSSAMSSSFEDPDKSYIGVGFIQYTLPNGDVKDLYVDSDNASLRGVANLINSDPSNGMRALVVQDGYGTDAPWRIILSLENTGDDALANFPYFYFVDGENDFFLDFEREAHDSLITLDGFEIELPSNKVGNIIPGINIDLIKEAPGNEFTIQIVEDVEKINERIKLIVEGINNILQFINVQNNIDANTDTTRTLGGDLSLQTIESKIRSAIFSPISTSTGEKRFSLLGISFQRSGLLGIDESRLKMMIAKDYKAVSEILVGRTTKDGMRHPGVISNINAMTKQFTKIPDGIIHTKKEGITEKVAQIDNQIERKERLLEKKEQTLKDKYAKLEGVIADLKGQMGGLAALGNSGGGGINPVNNLG